MLPENDRILFGDWCWVRTLLVFTWRCTILVASLFGNIVIMIATVKHQAIRLGQVTTTLICHLTVSSLCLSVFGITPMLMFTLMGDPGSADLLCMVSCYALTLFILSNLQMVCVLNICKLVIVQFPLRCKFLWSRRFGHCMACVSWGLSFLASFVFTGFNGRDIYFDHRIRSCMFSTISESDRWFRLVTLSFSMGIPGVLIMFSSVCLFYRVLEHRGANITNRTYLQIQSIVTIIAIAIAYCLSHLAFLVSLIYNAYLVSDSQLELHSPRMSNGTGRRTVLVEYNYDSQSPVSSFMYNYFYFISCMLTLLNSSVNFFIYKAYITSFRKYVEVEITGLCLQNAASLFTDFATTLAGFTPVAPADSKSTSGEKETEAVSLDWEPESRWEDTRTEGTRALLPTILEGIHEGGSHDTHYYMESEDEGGI